MLLVWLQEKHFTKQKRTKVASFFNMSVINVTFMTFATADAALLDAIKAKYHNKINSVWLCVCVSLLSYLFFKKRQTQNKLNYNKT